MTTVGKVVLGMMGRLRPKPASGDSASTIVLPKVDPHGGMPLMEALAARRSSREFAPDALPLPLLAGLMWAVVRCQSTGRRSDGTHGNQRTGD